jgi:hypothetical protein
MDCSDVAQSLGVLSVVMKQLQEAILAYGEPPIKLQRVELTLVVREPNELDPPASTTPAPSG